MKAKFNKNQEKAVTFFNGPCLVLAGPGSGKTYVLTNRILYLIIEKNIDPGEILVITFTRASALEMKNRFIKLLNENHISINDLPTFGTFHSVFYEILKDSFGYDNNSLISEQDQFRIIYEILEKNDKIDLNKSFVSNIIKDLNAYKLAMEREEKFSPRYISSRSFKEIYKQYDEMVFNYKKLDFSDMITKCYELLSLHKDVLKLYQERYKYVLIDEFQDINDAQYELTKLICKTKNLFVVGDDDQSIYKFRGSRPKVMKEFIRDYRNCKQIILSENYRCAKIIVNFSKRVIDYNKDRFKKDLVSNRPDIGKIEIKAFVDSTEENSYIVDLIRKYLNKGLNYSDIAILYRTNLLSNSISALLNKYNIPYFIKGNDNSIYDCFAIKDIISHLKVATNEYSIEDLMNISNKPLRYISREAINYNNSKVEDILYYYRDKKYMNKSLNKLCNNLNTIKKCITPLAIRYIRTEVGYDKYLKEYCKSKNIEYENTIEILDAFEEESIGYNDKKLYLKYIEDQKTDNINKDENEDSIKLMTFHLSKGLEFKVVIIIDANDGIIPHKRSIKDKDIESERRLFYVGATRAKDYLHIFFTTRRFGKNFSASRFINEAVGG